jgi:hypothetical protein
MKKLLLIALVLTSGCSTYQSGNYQIGPYDVQTGQALPAPVQQIVTDPGMYVADTTDGFLGGMFTQPINDPFTFVNQANQLISGVAGPNDVSGVILEGQNYYRNAVAVLENPWQGFFALRNLWVK